MRDVPSEAKQRQRLDEHAEVFRRVVGQASEDFLRRVRGPVIAPANGWIPVYCDVSPFDNGRSHKAGVWRTAKGFDGGALMLAYPESEELAARWGTPRAGKRLALFSVTENRLNDARGDALRPVMLLTERTIDQHRQVLLGPELRLEGWWTSLRRDEATIIRPDADHGTSEQFHGEFKTELDLERLPPPSGKFATNALALPCAQLAYRLLRWLGQQGLPDADAPPRHKATRRRLRTVMPELMYLAARLVRTGRRLNLVFGTPCQAVVIYRRLYRQLGVT